MVPRASRHDGLRHGQVKGIDPRVRDAYHSISSNHDFLLTYYYLSTLHIPPPTFILSSQERNEQFVTLFSLVVSLQTRHDVTDAAVDKLYAVLGSMLNLEALLTADAISKVGFCRRKTQFVFTPPSCPPQN